MINAKLIDLYDKRKGKVISSSFNYQTANIMSFLRFVSVVVLELPLHFAFCPGGINS